MKQKFFALLLALALAAGLTIPAGAYTLDRDGNTIWPNEETTQITNTYRFIWKDQGIFETAADNWNFCGEFHDGLLLIHEDHTDPTTLTDNYVDKNGSLVDLNHGRYGDMFPFSEGYAAAFTLNKSRMEVRQVFIDTEGNQVITGDDSWRWFGTYAGPIYAGRFENGRALVLREAPAVMGSNGYKTSYIVFDWEDWAGIEYAYIDAKGNYVTEWKLADTRSELIKLPLYDQNGVWIGHREDPDAWAAAAGTAQGSTGQSQEEAFQPEYHAPELPDYNAAAPSLFASTARVTGFHLGDLDFGAAEVTITNPTQFADAGVVAVVFVNVDNSNFAGDGDGVFFVPYELGPGESGVYSIRMTGIFNQEMFTYGVKSTYAEQLAGHVASTVFTFKDDADLLNFYDTVPYEQYWYPQGHVNEFQPICDGQPGTDWLKGVAGISRRTADLEHHEYYLPDGSRLNAAEADHYTYCGY